MSSEGGTYLSNSKVIILSLSRPRMRRHSSNFGIVSTELTGSQVLNDLSGNATIPFSGARLRRTLFASMNLLRKPDCNDFLVTCEGIQLANPAGENRTSNLGCSTGSFGSTQHGHQSWLRLTILPLDAQVEDREKPKVTHKVFMDIELEGILAANMSKHD